MTDPRIIAHRDQDALNALRLGSVVLDRAGQVWQVLLIPTPSQGPTRGWFRLLAGGTAHGAAAVAEAGPLRVLYNRDVDIPAHVHFCALCMGMTVELEDQETPCSACAGMGWQNELDGSLLTLPEAIGIAANMAPVATLQAMLPPESLIPGMTVRAEPKPAHALSHPTYVGIVVSTYRAGNLAAPTRVELDVFTGRTDGPDPLRVDLSSTAYSFRPVDE